MAAVLNQTIRLPVPAPYDARKVRSQFSMSLANLSQMHVFWRKAEQRISVRSTRRSIEDAYKPSRGRGGALPKEAIYVGTYTEPFPASAFITDLDDLLASLGIPRAPL